ncbi:hypothetical protein [Streptomyces ardesiacus]
MRRARDFGLLKVENLGEGGALGTAGVGPGVRLWARWARPVTR